MPGKYFYPRPPRGGRLARYLNPSFFITYFYPRPPRGGRPRELALYTRQITISIHALREEGDLHAICAVLLRSIFLSTPSARRATGLFYAHNRYYTHFYPRPPRGGRQAVTSSARPRYLISIHALREEGDLPAFHPVPVKVEFLSTPSARRATLKPKKKAQKPKIFLSTPSARRATKG